MKNNYIEINDDYAILSTKNYCFYYGYEFDKKICGCGDEKEIWGFEVKKDSINVFRISADEMQEYKDCPNKWQCEKMLLFGIGLYLDNVEKEKENPFDWINV